MFSIITFLMYEVVLILVSIPAATLFLIESFLYPPQRVYISFVNTFVTPRNNDLGPLFLGDI